MFTARDLFKAAAIAAALFALYLVILWTYRPPITTTGESPRTALLGDLAQLNNAVYLYREQHNGLLPDPARIDQQLTRYTDLAGHVGPLGPPRDPYIFGPYLRAIPTLPLGPQRGKSTIATTPSPGVAWVYNAQTGTIRANCDDQPTGPQFEVPPPTTSH